MMTKQVLLYGVLGGGLLLVSVASAEVIEVPIDFDNIQDAINSASEGDEIIVGPGTYFETIDLLGRAVHLHSSDGPEVTIIDGGGQGSVIICASGEGRDTIIEGLTVTGGFSILGGGGMHNLNGSEPTVINCIFTQNIAFNGGGMRNDPGTSPLVTNCQFLFNIADSLGGAIYSDESSLFVDGSTFASNTAESGGGVYVAHGSALLENSYFTDNDANDGGALFNQSGSVTALNCEFTHNPCVWRGGAIHHFTGTLEVINGAFFGNTAGLQGGAIWNLAELSVINSTLAANNSDVGGAIFNDNVATVSNSILWSNEPQQVFDERGSSTAIFYSVVEGGWAGDGSNNVSADPLFVDLMFGDLRLSAGSPSIDAADNDAVPIGVTTDLDGHDRIVDDPDTEDSGNGGRPIVDMGAYEFGSGCFADLTADGAVNAADLALLLGSWGPCQGCAADLNPDDTINAADLALLLGAWGACP